MKKLLSFALSLGLIASFSTSVFAYGADQTGIATTSAPVTSNDFTVYTNGDVSISVAPDIAYLSLGIVTETATSASATEENAKITNQVLNALYDAGIDKKDIQTQYYNIYPMYNYADDYQSISGYNVSHGLIVTVRDISKVGEILDIAIANGVNTTSGVTFDIENKDEYYTQALLQAVDVAIDKGNAIAASVGVTNPQVASIAESSVYYQPVTYTTNDIAAKTEQSTTIQSSNVTVYASVSVAMTK